MKVITALDLVLGRIERVFLFCANGLLLAMLVINLANILSRLLFDIGLIWVFPWTSVLFVWSIFLAFFVIFRRGQDISIDVLTRRLPERVAIRLEIAISCAVIVLLIVILAQIPTLIPRQVGRIDMVGIQRYWLSIPFFFSSFLVLVDYGVKIVHAYLRLRGSGDSDPVASGTGAGGVGA